MPAPQRYTKGKQGWKAQFFRGIYGLSNVRQALVRTRKRAHKTFAVSSINYKTSGSPWRGLSYQYRDNFVARFTGILRVPRSGHYHFWTTSDDGSKLWVNGRQVVNNDGLHGMRTRYGRVFLKQGKSFVKAVMFERGGGAGLVVSWAGPGVKKQLLGKPFVTASGAGKAPRKRKSSDVVLKLKRKLVAHKKRFARLHRQYHALRRKDHQIIASLRNKVNKQLKVIKSLNATIKQFVKKKAERLERTAKAKAKKARELKAKFYNKRESAKKAKAKKMRELKAKVYKKREAAQKKKASTCKDDHWWCHQEDCGTDADVCKKTCGEC